MCFYSWTTSRMLRLVFPMIFPGIKGKSSTGYSSCPSAVQVLGQVFGVPFMHVCWDSAFQNNANPLSAMRQRDEAIFKGNRIQQLHLKKSEV